MSAPDRPIEQALALALEQAVEQGLVTVERHPSDPSRDVFTLTDKGRAYVEDMKPREGS